MNFFKTVAVIGTGTAGVTTLSHLLAWLPKDWKIVSIHDPDTPMLGIGESTTTQIPESLYYGAHLNLLEDLDSLDLTVKHGVRYSNWREHDIYTKIPPPHYAIHFNNFKLKDVCFKKFSEIWGDKFEVIEGKITDIQNLPNNVLCKVSNNSYSFDYMIDCRGYPTDYSDYYEVNTIPVNHCLVHTINKPGDWNYTHHQAHPNGWMFGIPLKHRQGWGYLYNDKITSKEDAVLNIADIFKTSPDNLNLREFSFKNYKAKKFIDGRIIKNGNRALFYEPIEALSGWFYDRIVRAFFDIAITKAHTEETANHMLHTIAEDYELTICYLYHGGSIYNSKFWEITKENCSTRLLESNRFAEMSSFLKEVTHQHYNMPTVIMPFPYKTWKQLDQDFGYHCFK
jgi:hypothetical protein